MSYNVNDLASYLKYESIIFNSNATNETAPGSAGALFADTATTALAGSTAANVEVDGQSTWSVNPLALLADPPIANFTYNVTENLTNPAYNVLVPISGLVNVSAFGNTYAGQAYPYNLSSDPNIMSLQDLYNFYQSNGFLANTSQWTSFSQPNGIGIPSTTKDLNAVSSFWQSTPLNQQVLNFWCDIQTANGIFSKTAPPATFQQFVQAIQSIQMVPASQAPAGTGTFVAVSNYASSIVPALATAPVPITTQPTSQQIFAGLMSSFVANYQTYFPNTSNATITPEEFATQFEQYIQNDLSQVLQNTPINIELSGGSSGSPIVLKQITAASIAPSNLGSSITFPPDFTTQFATDLFNEYSSALQTSTDWQGVTPPTLNVQSNFNKSFNFFLQQVTGNSTLSAEGQNFFTMWSEFVGPSTFLQTASNSSVSNELGTYQEMYNVFYPDQPQLFASRLSSFIQNALNAPAGVFNPSLLIDQWFTKLQEGFSNLTTSLDQAGFSNVAIIGQVYNGILDVINDLQSLTLAQANRLNFYSDYSEAYTNEIYNVPFLLPNDGTPIDLAADPASTIATGTGSQDVATGPSPAVQASTFRQQADTAANQWVQNLQNFRSEVTSQAQNQQSVVQSSNSAVNQETNFATFILQMISQLLQSIFNSQSASSGSSAP